MGMNYFALNFAQNFRQEFDSSGIHVVPLCSQPNLMHDSNISLQWKQTDCLLPQAMYNGHAVLVGNFVYAGGGICQKKDSEYVVFKCDYRKQHGVTNALYICGT